MKKLLIFAALLVCAGCCHCKSNAGIAPHVIHALYKSADGRTVVVDYLNDEDRIVAVLWDGKRLALPHAISADGARYSDGSWTVWNKGNNVMVLNEKADKIVFDGVEQP